jgi:hypothetical protein
MASTTLRNPVATHGDVLLPQKGNTTIYSLTSNPYQFYEQYDTGIWKKIEMTTDQAKNAKELMDNIKAIKQYGYTKIFSFIFHHSSDDAQSKRLIDAYDSYSSIDLMLRTLNFDLARTTVALMLKNKDIQQSDSALMLKYMNIGEQALVNK